MWVQSKVLVVEADPAARDAIVSALPSSSFVIDAVADGRHAERRLDAVDFDVLVVGAQSADHEGISLSRKAAQMSRDLSIIIITERESVELVVEAMRAGASDFLVRPVAPDLLRLTVENAVERHRLLREVRRLKERVDSAPRPLPGLVGESPPILQVQRLVDRVGPTEASVLITGESGTGKEVVARALHDQSPRRGGPFVAINCTALPEALMESQLFGHKKGAFTDARADAPGLLLEASGGTLFLDEIGDMPLSLQPKLLRAIQERTVRPVGGSREVPLDVRIIAATHQNLDQKIQAGTFREDLYYRLCVVEVDLPPLRVRGNDVLLLAQHFLELHSVRYGVDVTGFSRAAGAAMLAYRWPGNVRELSNTIERAVALCSYDEIGIDDLPAKLKGAHDDAPTADHTILELEEVERAHILRVFDLCQQNKAQTAQVLGIDRKTLYRKLARYGAVEDVT